MKERGGEHVRCCRYILVFLSRGLCHQSAYNNFLLSSLHIQSSNSLISHALCGDIPFVFLLLIILIYYKQNFYYLLFYYEQFDLLFDFILLIIIMIIIIMIIIIIIIIIFIIIFIISFRCFIYCYYLI